jgi:hypothetical protein
MNHHKLKDDQMNVMTRKQDVFLVSDEIVKFNQDKQLLRALEKSHKSSVLGFVGVSFLIAMSFIQMTFGALIILDQFPETSWIMNSVMSLF